MLFIQKPSDSAVYPVPGVIHRIPKKLASWQDSRSALSIVITEFVNLNPYSSEMLMSAFMYLFCVFFVVVLFFRVFPPKGKPPTKKAKVLQKQPLMAKLAAYAQYQASQQNQAKSKAGMLSLNTLNC